MSKHFDNEGHVIECDAAVIAVLTTFFQLLDKWDREAKSDGKGV